MKFTAAFLPLLLLPLGAMAQGMPAPADKPAAGKVAVELNNLEQADKACRVTFVVTNGLAAEIGELALETVLFDRANVVQRFVVLKSGRLPAGRTRVRQFDLPELSCDRIGRILVNDVTECSAAQMSPAACIAAVAVSSRAKVGLEF
jgi:hypothetical protein